MAQGIKIIRARKLSPEIYGKADEAIMESISPRLFMRLTARELAEVRRCLNAHWFKAREFERREILAEGGVWSQSAECFLELRRPESNPRTTGASGGRAAAAGMSPEARRERALNAVAAREAKRLLLT